MGQLSACSMSCSSGPEEKQTGNAQGHLKNVPSFLSKEQEMSDCHLSVGFRSTEKPAGGFCGTVKQRGLM